MDIIPARPTLTVGTGLISNPNDLMILCFKDFLVSDYSQTTILRGHISSLKYILSNYSDKYEIRDAIKNSLELIYSNYFQNVMVLITMDDYSSGSIVTYTINISGYQDANQYVLSQVISQSNKELLNYDEIIYDFRKNLRRIDNGN